MNYAIEVLQAQRDEHLQALAMGHVPDSSVEIVERQVNELLTAIQKLKS